MGAFFARTKSFFKISKIPEKFLSRKIFLRYNFLNAQNKMR